MNAQISDQTYQKMVLDAKNRGVAPDKYLDWLINQVPDTFACTGDDFFRLLGASDEDIAQIKKDAALLPDDPDW